MFMSKVVSFLLDLKFYFLVYFTIVLPHVENVDSCHKGSFENN